MRLAPRPANPGGADNPEEGCLWPSWCLQNGLTWHYVEPSGSAADGDGRTKEMAMNTKKSMAVLILSGLMVAPSLAFFPDGNPGVYPPTSPVFGRTYAEWSAAWWQWALSLPVDQHPLFDTADCSA